MDQNTQDFIQTKRLAVVGVSRSAVKFGTTIYNDLKARSYEMYGVNSQDDTITMCARPVSGRYGNN